MPRIVTAKIDFSALDHEPPETLALARVRESKVNHDASFARKLIDARKPTHVPHEKARIELLALESTPDPARAPVTELHHDRAQFLPGLREAILQTGPAALAAHDAYLLELSQALRQERRRHARNAAANVVEALTAAEDFAHDQRGPAFAEDFGRTRHRAELAIATHEQECTAVATRSQLHILDLSS